jgi:O-antigen/teichoic acid export membrane protein
LTTRNEEPRYRSAAQRRLGEGDIDDLTAETLEARGTSASITRRQLRGSSLLLVGRLIALVLNFAVQLLIVRYLSQADYGAFAYALSLVALGETAVTIGLDRGVGRFLAMYDERGDHARLLGTLALTAGIVLSLGLAVVLVVIGLGDALIGTAVSDPHAVALLIILIVLAPIQAADNLLSGILAVFASARAIFFRKYLLAPGLRLAVVGLLIAGQEGVEFLAAGYVLTGLAGVLLYGGMLWRILVTHDIGSGVGWRDVRIPVREILAFTIPLMTTDLVYLALNTSDAIILGHFWGTTEVAQYRVVQPLVGLNQVVYSSFTLLYMPAASRLFARGDRDGVAHLYWRTAIWMAVFSFPIFALTTSLAGPVMTAYESRYADSAVFLAMLSFAAYINVALGFNGLTLRVYGFVRYAVAINLAAAAISLVLNLLLIPRFGALGAATATTISLISFNVLKQIGLRLGTGISMFDRRYIGVYATIGAAAIALTVSRVVLGPSLLPSLLLTAVASLVVLGLTRGSLDVAETFPELLRLPFARRILGA